MGKYHRICCSVDRSRIDKSFRLIFIQPPDVLIPETIAGKCIVHRYNNKLALHDELVHVYSIIRNSLYEYEVKAETLEEKNNVLKKRILIKRSLFCLAYFHAKLECELVFKGQYSNGIISDDVFLTSHEVLVSILLNFGGDSCNDLIRRCIVEGIYENELLTWGENSTYNVSLVNKIFDQIFIKCDRLTSTHIDQRDRSSKFLPDIGLSDAIAELKRSRETFDLPEDAFRNFLQRHEKHVNSNTMDRSLSENVILM